MAATLAAAAARDARLVFVDNLYMYGPQNAPLREDMALVDCGGKPAVRAAITRQWMAEAQAGRVKVAALRAPDFYGPGVLQSHLGEVGFKAIAAGKPAALIARPDMPHAFAYTPDFGRGVATLIDAPDECFNQAWHLPCPPLQTPRELLALGAAAIGRKARIQALPPFLLGPMGLVSPFMREIGEMGFQWDRPYDVDWRKWAGRFWSDPTPHEVGTAETTRSFVDAASAAA
jgi:nucleoside-diphosphate-sugar epimerase